MYHKKRRRDAGVTRSHLALLTSSLRHRVCCGPPLQRRATANLARRRGCQRSQTASRLRPQHLLYPAL